MLTSRYMYLCGNCQTRIPDLCVNLPNVYDIEIPLILSFDEGTDLRLKRFSFLYDDISSLNTFYRLAHYNLSLTVPKQTCLNSNFYLNLYINTFNKVAKINPVFIYKVVYFVHVNVSFQLSYIDIYQHFI